MPAGLYHAPTTLAAVAARAYVDVDDAREVLVWWFGDGAELDPEQLPAEYGDAVADVLCADLRALAHPPTSLVGDLALEYRETGDPAILDELRARGYRDRAGSLDFERPRPDDEPSVLATRAITRESNDRWIEGMPFDEVPKGSVRHLLGSPTER